MLLLVVASKDDQLEPRFLADSRGACRCRGVDMGAVTRISSKKMAE